MKKSNLLAIAALAIVAVLWLRRKQQDTGDSDIVLSGLMMSPTVANLGDTVQITVTATNQGTVPGSRTATLEMTGYAPESRSTQTLYPGASVVLTWNRTPAAIGTYDVSVEGLSATLEVVGVANVVLSDLSMRVIPPSEGPWID